MPKNRFPDSLEKRELRRIDRRLLDRFLKRRGTERRLNYCGMPSVEHLDIVEWKDCLDKVVAIEYCEDVAADMEIEWGRLGFQIPHELNVCNVYDFLRDTTQVFDLYNLDFYGGFIYEKNSGGSNATEALRALIARHAAAHKSFILISTFNARENAENEYDRFINNIESALAGCSNVADNCADHRKKQHYKTKLGYTYFCWDVGRAAGFKVVFPDIYYYVNSESGADVSLIHFYCEFDYLPQALPVVGDMDDVVRLANKPLYQMRGMVPMPVFRPTIVT